MLFQVVGKRNNRKLKQVYEELGKEEEKEKKQFKFTSSLQYTR